jgi:hypothetical protein
MDVRGQARESGSFVGVKVSTRTGWKPLLDVPMFLEKL